MQISVTLTFSCSWIFQKMKAGKMARITSVNAL